MANLPELIQMIEDGLAALPSSRAVDPAGDYEALRDYLRAAEALLDSFIVRGGANIVRGGNEWKLRMAGVRASSTGGAAQLLRNWKAGAERLLASLRTEGGAA